MPEHLLPAATQPIPTRAPSAAARSASPARPRSPFTLLARLAALLLLPAALLLAGSAQAQPVVGSVVQGMLDLGGGSLVGLPDGRWRVISVFNQPRKVAGQDTQARTVAVQSEDAAAAVPLLVVRAVSDRMNWERSVCEENSATAWLVDRHDTLHSQLVTKCSRWFTLARFSDWTKSVETNAAWTPILAALGSSPPWAAESTAFLEFSVRRWQGQGIFVNAFVRTAPMGIDPFKLRDLAREGREEPAHSVLRAWSRGMVSASGAAFIDGVRTVRMPALGGALQASATAAVRSGTGTTPPPVAGRTDAVLSEQAARDRIHAMLDQSRPGQPVSPATAQSVSPVTAQPIAPVTAQAIKPVTAAPVIPVGPASAVSPAPVVSPAGPAPTVRPPGSPPTVAGATPPAPAPATPGKLGPIEELAAELAKLREELRRQQAASSQPSAQPSAQPVAQAPANVAAAKAPSAPSARRLALVIGNDSYSTVSPLQNARADARAMAAQLGRMGYSVTLRTDLTERAMKDELRQFNSRIQGGDEVLFFFAGHGVQIGGTNYLLPADIRGESAEQVRDDALPLQKVLDDIQDRKARFTLAIIDACRDNPFKGTGRAIGARGMATTTPATGQMVLFSAGAGQQALDRLNPSDRDPNGLFTRVLLRQIEQPGVSVDRLMRAVRAEVVAKARAVGHEQVPALYDQSIGEFFFRD
ncbi:MAG: caspase family protein [Burkholderiales bacterium]